MIVKKVAIITGASRGIGKEIAIGLSKAGYKVIVNYCNRKDLAEKVVEEISSNGGEGFPVKADVSKINEVKELISTTLDKYNRIDVLVNNAGIYKDSTIVKMDNKTWNDVINVNLTGTFNCTKEALKHMIKRKEGRIVNISSVVGQIGIFGTSNYSASKAGLFGLTKAVSKEVATKGITVNSLCLGYFETGMLKQLPKNIQKDILNQIPMKRFGSLPEVVDVLAFLCSPSAGYITGQIIHINGGYYM